MDMLVFISVSLTSFSIIQTWDISHLSFPYPNPYFPFPKHPLRVVLSIIFSGGMTTRATDLEGTSMSPRERVNRHV
jgi:hypothetical protein